MGLITIEEFSDKYLNKSVDYDRNGSFQCPDLFNFYLKEVIGAPFISNNATGGARDIFEAPNSERDKYFKIVNRSDGISPADVLVYGEPHGRVVENGKTIYYGHVQIAVSDSMAINQNGLVKGKVTIDPILRVGLLGILRPLNYNSNKQPQSDENNKTNTNTYKIISGDTFWALEEKNGWEHGTLQKLNPTLNPKKLQIEQNIIIPTQKESEKINVERHYTIKSGDTFWGLEDAFGLSHGTLQQLNPGVEPRKLQIGQDIRIL